jgi:hypothetical protein
MGLLPLSVPSAAPRRSSAVAPALRSRRKFLRFFPGGFHDETYLDWERSYKWETHRRWQEALGREEFRSLLRARQFSEIAARAVRASSSAPATA